MKTSSQELELRNILQGLEEFATFISYQSDYSGLRIISVESTDSSHDTSSQAYHSAEIVSFPLRAKAG